LIHRDRAAPGRRTASWEGKSGLAGIELPLHVKSIFLSDLGAWTEERFGDLRRDMEQNEGLELAAIRVGTYQ
jgi:hypothetical protein